MKWFSDSQSACKIMQVGSMRSDLHAIALEIFSSAPIMVYRWRSSGSLALKLTELIILVLSLI